MTWQGCGPDCCRCHCECPSATASRAAYLDGLGLITDEQWAAIDAVAEKRAERFTQAAARSGQDGQP